MDMDLYDDTYDRFCELIKNPSPHIFEIGCGPGNITKYILSKNPNFNIDAIDVAPNMIDLAQKNNPTAHFEVMDCREISNLITRYDAIICGFCMPYLSREDCKKLIQDCSTLLSDEGILYFSTIEGDYSQSGPQVGKGGNIVYTYYYQEDYLREVLQENNFELIELSRKNYLNAVEKSSVHMIFIARKMYNENT